MSHIRRLLYFCIAITIFTAGCTAPTARRGSHEVGFDGKNNEGKRVVTQVELQESLQRFSSNFTGRIGQAGSELYESSDPQIRKSAMRQVLLYQSSALDI